MPLPEDFPKIMRPFLGDEYDKLENAILSETPKRGLRVNTLKISVEEFASISPFPLTPSSLCRDAFVTAQEEKLGLHPFHHAGLYYVQEPSASAAVEVLDPKPGEWVLDLCAAPGGKSTHIASRLFDREGSLLVANEIVPRRAKILSSNLERIGTRNAVVCCASPEDFARICPDTFDAVLVDAPCSGEGMFRRDEHAVRDYNAEHVESCAARQKLILDSAAECVRAGGRLVYSTCTFNPYEDEGVVEDFLSRHPDFSIAKIKTAVLPSAHPEWIGAREEIRLAAKPMPHLCEGEGHFIALLIRAGDDRDTHIIKAPENMLVKNELKNFEYFWENNFSLPIFGTPYKQGEFVYIDPAAPALPRKMRGGVCAAELLRGRIEPCHGLYLALRKDEILNHCVFSPESAEIAAFLRGESIKCDAFTGFGAVSVGWESSAWNLGFGKISGGILKNHYPKGLRI